jgi:hypothetical protein
MGGSTPEAAKTAMDAWMAWGAGAGAALVDWGSPTQPTSTDDPGPAGWIGGYSIIAADDSAAAQVLLASHPHHEVGTIELLELLPMPGS